MIPVRSHSARAEGFGRTARVMAALRRRRALWISCFHLRWSDFVDICWPLRLDAMSAAYCSVRVTAGCTSLRFLACSGSVSDQKLPALRPPEPLRRTGTVAVVRRSAGLDCVSVSPLGSVVMPGSASFSPPHTA